MSMGYVANYIIRLLRTKTILYIYLLKKSCTVVVEQLLALRWSHIKHCTAQFSFFNLIGFLLTTSIILP